MNIPVLKAGVSAYFDSFGGRLLCTVDKIVKHGDYLQAHLTMRFTRGGYAAGETVIAPTRYVMPVDAVYISPTGERSITLFTVEVTP